VGEGSLLDLLRDPASLALQLAQLKSGLPCINLHDFLKEIPEVLLEVRTPFLGYSMHHRLPPPHPSRWRQRLQGFGFPTILNPRSHFHREMVNFV